MWFSMRTRDSILLYLLSPPLEMSPLLIEIALFCSPLNRWTSQHTHTNTDTHLHFGIMHYDLNVWIQHFAHTLRIQLYQLSSAHSSWQWLKGIEHTSSSRHHQYTELSKTNPNMITLTFVQIRFIWFLFTPGVSATRHTHTHIDYITTKLDVCEFEFIKSKEFVLTETSFKIHYNLNNACANYLLHVNGFPVCLEYFVFRSWKRKFKTSSRILRHFRTHTQIYHNI